MPGGRPDRGNRVGDDTPMPDSLEGGPPADAAMVTTAEGTRPEARPEIGSMSRFRWVICALLFFATTINYIDRGVLGVLAPGLQETIGWTDTQYGDINAAFSLAY